MSYDEVFSPFPRFTDAEIQEIPAVSNGEIKVRAPRGILNLMKVRSSEPIENWVAVQLQEGSGLVVRQSHRFKVEGETQAVAWVGEPGGDYFVVCDHVAEIDPLSPDYDEHVFACQAITSAINYRATRAREILRNDEYLKRKNDEDSLIKMAAFLVSYVHHHPDAWTGTHRGGVGLVGGFAQTFGRSYEEMRGVVQEMRAEGVVELSGPYDQVVSLPKAA